MDRIPITGENHLIVSFELFYISVEYVQPLYIQQSFTVMKKFTDFTVMKKMKSQTNNILPYRDASHVSATIYVDKPRIIYSIL